MDRQFDSVRIKDITLNYITEGTGISLLVVGSSIYYPRTFSKDLKEFFKITYADLPHFVQVDSDFQLDAMSFDLYAQCIEAIRSAAGIENFVIVGHSHHGNIAFEYAKRYPREVSHVVLIGSPPVDINLTKKGSRQYWENHASDNRKALLRKRRSQLDRENPGVLSAQEVYVRQYVADAPLYWHNPAYDASWLWKGMTFEMEVVNSFRDLFKSYELIRDKAHQIPTLVVMGRHDFAVPYTLWEPILPTLQNVTFKLLERSGHTPQLEEPERFNEIIKNWLRS